ncbi:MAG: hypothetical protein FWB78_02685, partial [Treponema sp.]|nr:hypothetical protein [Treponema sp.]
MLNKKRAVGFILVPLMFMMAVPVWAGGGGDRLRGMDVVIGNWWADYDVNTFQPQSDMDARVLAYRRRMLNENNFSMRVSRIASWGEMLQTAAISIMAGQPAASAFVLTPAWAMTLHRQGLIAPLQHANVDFTPARPGEYRPTWNRSMMNLFTFGGNTYALSLGYGDSLQPLVIFFNKRLFREAGL